MSRDPFGAPPARKPVMNQPRGADNSGTAGSAPPSGTSVYEGSKADMVQDRAGAKRMGVSQSAYERTPQDAKQDAAGQAGYQNAMFGKRK